MSNWFEGESEIDCTLQQVKQALENHGEHYVGVIRLMPGMTSVALVEQGPDFVTIRTNEGLMKRTNITKRMEAERVVVAFDEEYQAGSKVTTQSHFVDTFTTSGAGVKYRAVISSVEAAGLLGFLYRNFGSKNMGKAFLASYKAYFEQSAAGSE